MESVQDFYDAHAERYEEFERVALAEEERFPLLHQIRRKERALITRLVLPGDKVFYFATGSGNDIVHLAGDLEARVVTLDFSECMISKAMKQLEDRRLLYVIDDVPEYIDARKLNKFFKRNPDYVILLKGDIMNTWLPPDYFDFCFCYCTLPLLGDASVSTLHKLSISAKSGAVSVYDAEKLPTLAEYYRAFGFEPTVVGRTIRLEGGFEYTSIPEEVMRETLSPHRSLEVISVGLGKIYQWGLKK